MKRLTVPLLLLFSIIIFSCSTVFAETSSLQISPAKTQISIAASETHTMSISVRNTAAVSHTVQADFRDTVVDSLGNRTVAPKGQTSITDGISSYASGASSVVIPAGITKIYTVTITIPANADAKTRYGAAVFMADGDSMSVASLIVATITAAPTASSTPPNTASSTTVTPSKPAATSTIANDPSTTIQPTDMNKAAETPTKAASQSPTNAQPIGNKIINVQTVGNTRVKQQLGIGAAIILIMGASLAIIFWRRQHTPIVVAPTAVIVAGQPVQPTDQLIVK